jgi:hypothetical protein
MVPKKGAYHSLPPAHGRGDDRKLAQNSDAPSGRCLGDGARRLCESPQSPGATQLLDGTLDGRRRRRVVQGAENVLGQSPLLHRHFRLQYNFRNA